MYSLESFRIGQAARPIRQPLIGLASICFLLLLWHLAVSILKPELVPDPLAVWRTFLTALSTGHLRDNIIVSLKRVLIGLTLASVVGTILGFAVATSSLARDALSPVLETLRPIPPIAWIPLAIAFFGIGDHPAYFVIFIGAFYPVFTNTVHGILEIPERYFEVARVFGAKAMEQAVSVRLPGALSSIFSGIKISLGFAWMCLIAAEMIAVKSGLGNQIQYDRNIMATSGVVADMLEIGLVGYAMVFLMSRLESILVPWLRNGTSEPVSHKVSRFAVSVGGASSGYFRQT